MKYYTIFILTVLYGCGESPSGTGNENFTVTSSLPAAEPKAPEESKEVSTEQVIPTRDIPLSAKLVTSIQAAPICNKETQGDLIYSQEELSFFYCQDLTWTIIDLKGKDGKDGQNGKDGNNGVDGTDGQDGINGKNVSTESTTWIHPIKGTKWFVGRPIQSLYYSNTSSNIMSPNFICPEGSLSPTESEYLDALAAGIWAKFSAFAPLFIKLGAITSQTEPSPGIFLYTYRIRAGNTAAYITDLNTTGYGTANALCIVTE